MSITSPACRPSLNPATSPSSRWSRWRWRSWPRSIQPGARRALRQRRHCAMNDATELPADGTPDAVIHCEALGKTYSEGTLYTPVFDGLDLTVHAGETVAILGASGAGKSTLLHLLGGLDTPTAGEVYVAGQK